MTENKFGLSELAEPLKKINEYVKLIEWAKSGKGINLAHGLSDTLKALVISSIAKNTGKPIIFITHNEIQARKIYEDILSFIPGNTVILPPGDLVFHRIFARSGETRLARLAALERLSDGGPLVLCASVEAIMSPISKPDILNNAFRTALMDTNNSKRKKSVLRNGLIYEPILLNRDLIKAGYERVAIVENHGQFSSRGGIIDVFPPAEDEPVRIEFFDDEIDTIRRFDPESQRSTGTIENIEIFPAFELILDESELKKIASAMNEELNEMSLKAGKKKNQAALVRESIGEDIEKLSQGIMIDGIEKYINYYDGNTGTIFEFSEEALIVIDESDRVKERCHAIESEMNENIKQLLENNRILPGQAVKNHNFEWLQFEIKGRKTLTLSNLLKNTQDFRPNDIHGFNCRSMQPFHGRISLVVEEINGWKGRNYSIVVLSGNEERGQRLAEALRDSELEAIYMDNLEKAPKPGQIIIVPGTLNGGFEFPGLKYAVLSDREVYAPSIKKKPIKKGALIKIFSELKIGDFVVHESHGVGQYLGIEKIKMSNLVKDYLVIKYQGTDKLFIPTDQMDLIQRYIGSEEHGPKLNKLGGAEWVKTKTKAKAAIEAMARDLMELYALRQQIKGHIFPEDSRWQREFEDAFSYEETSDQLKCVEDIKSDMESDKVMDRLLCGDVGFGKTEVALRAVFKCITSGKQAAILVPTTILAQQHYNTCIKRFSNFPMNVGQLSRFRSAKEVEDVTNGLKKGSIDLVIGTHRLLSEDIGFKDLGLLVVDEEQRFGVMHKEKIKNLRKNVDVITLSATPIPRTLHMSMIGVRDISVIEEPPEERYPVQTYVMEHDNDIVREALIREISRGGQVYYLHNKVSSISQMASKIAALVPEAKVAYAHGKMAEHQLEKTMMNFYNGEFDVLVCTTIIETGLDIPNVNTIIVSDSDKMGLSQLYQLRGRVGRSNRVAYAYLTYQRDKVLTETAEKRLVAIKEFTELGSGFKIAMRDLELRGAGNLLGTSQSGHLESIGYELYIKMLDETVKQLKGEGITEDADTQVEVSVEAHIPDSYINESAQKIDVYRKISFIENKEDISELTDELIDRFGDVPLPVQNLFIVSYIRNNCRRAGVTNFSQKENVIKVKFKVGGITPEQAIKLAGYYPGKLLFSAGELPYFTIKITKEESLKPMPILVELVEHLSGKA